MIKKILLLILCVSGLMTFSQTVLNDNQSIRFKHYALTEGLSQSSVLCVLQDSKGFLWFGTRDGLNKFDGEKFVTYRHNSQDSTSISNSYIKSLIEDTQGNLWVGTMNGLNRYLESSHTFERFNKNLAQNNWSNDEIWDLALAPDGTLYLGTNQGLEQFDFKKRMPLSINKQGPSAKNQNEPVRALLMDHRQNLWICYTNGIQVFNPVAQTVNILDYPEESSKATYKNYAPVVYQDDQHNIWLGYKNGLFQFDENTARFQPYQFQDSFMITDEVRDLHQDRSGNLWVGTYNGLYLYYRHSGKLFHYVHDENDRTSLSQNSIYTIYEDTKGDIWLGTYAGGISYYDRSYDVFKSFTAGANNSKLNYMVVSAIVEDPDHNLWIGTEGGGINVYNGKTGRFTYYTHQSNNPKSLSTDNVKTMIRAHDGRYWIGTHDGGLNVLDLKKDPNNFKKYWFVPTDSTGLSNNRVISLFEDARQNIWIGTSGGGLDKWHHETESIIRLSDSEAPVGPIIYAITPTSSKTNLLVSGNKGLAKINILTHKWTPIDYKNPGHEAIHIHATLYAYEDPEQNLWIATEGDGLYYYNTSTQQSIKYGMSDGLPNEVIYGILPDDYNTLWLSTNKGLSRFDLEKKTFDNFDVSDGLVSNEFNYGAFKKLPNGDLMFGNANGITYFNPNNITKNAFVPPVVITSFWVNNQPVELEDDLAETPLRLNYTQNALNFNFVGLSYSKPNKNQYAYKLEGFDTDWISAGNRNAATYTNLNSGTYVFRVKAANNDGVWNEEGASMAFTIRPAPWKTWWAYLIYFGLGLSLFLIIRRYSLLRIHERNELKRERLEKERMEEINQMKLRLFTNVSHDFRTPLTLIIGPLERMLHKKIGSAYIQRQHEIMHRNASVLLQLINQLLDFRKSESGQLKLAASEGDIVPFIENIKTSFDELARLQDINYEFYAEQDSISLWFDKINLKKVVYNLLSNAFKFTPSGGHISIHLSVVHKIKRKLPGNEFLRLEIQDSGRGVPKDNLKFIFDRFYQLGQDSTTRSGTGIGLALTKSIVELHQGSVKVKSKEGKGTAFIILLPLGQAHLSPSDRLEEKDDAPESYYFNHPNYKIQDLPSEALDDELAEQENLSDTTILIVEDNLEVRQFIKSIFETNYAVLEAEHGEMAIEIANNHKVDLIVSDVMMPKMNGIDMCTQIKTNILTSHIPVILLTAKTSETAQQEGYETGADAYITKPFNAHLLEMQVHNLLKTRRKLMERFKKELILEPSEPQVVSQDDLFLQKAIGLVEAHINDSDYTINDFINEMGMSRSALYRKLKALTDQSITEFIRTIKLKRAGQLILKTQLNISEIAFDLGFNDLKHFRKSFQKLFDELPSEYRAKFSDSLENPS